MSRQDISAISAHAGEERPANGEFTVELAVNRAFTTLSYGGSNVARFGDGDDHEEFDVLEREGQLTTCITEPNSALLKILVW